MDNRRDPQGGIRFLAMAGMAMTCLAGTTGAQAQNAAQTLADTGVIHPTVLPAADIDWAGVAQAFSPDQEESFDRLDGFVAQKDAFDVTSLPILMPGPRSGISLSRMTFSSFGDAYGMALPQPRSDSDVTIVITASRGSVAAAPGTIDPGQFETLNVGGQSVPATIEPTEGGWTASFERYGALYSVDVDCGNQGADSPCQDASYIRQVTASLNYVALGRLGQGRIDAFPPPDHVASDQDRLGPPDRPHRRPEDRYGPWRWPEPRPDKTVYREPEQPQPEQPQPEQPQGGQTKTEKPGSGGFGDWLKRIFHPAPTETPPVDTPPKGAAGAVNGQDVR